MSPNVSAVPAAVITKDLRLRLRGWRWAGVTSLYAAILAGIAIAFLARRYSLVSSSPAQAGIDLFQALSFGQLFLIVFVTPAALAGAISGERQHRTWELLVASRASAAGIVIGKLLAGVAFSLVLLASSLPLYGLVFLFGGVSPADMIPTFLVLLITVLLLSACSLTVSALTARLTVSYMLATLVALLLTVGLTTLTLYLQSPDAVGLTSLGSLPFQTSNTPTALPPFAQIDPLVALLGALPADGGGTLLGGLGTVQHAFGLSWIAPLWSVYVLLGAVISILLVLATIRLVRTPRTPLGRPLLGRLAGERR